MMKLLRRCALLAGVAAVLGLAGGAAAQAPAFPERPVRVVVPIAAGGGTDVFARMLAELAAPALRQPVVVENRAGASGTIGLQAVLDAPRDGHTIAFVWNAPMTSVPHTLGTRYTLDDFEPMFIVGHAPFTICVRPDHPARTAQDLIGMIRARPAESVSYGNEGVGGTMHLAAERLFRRLDLRVQAVPFQGASQTLNAFMGGHIDLYGGSVAVVMNTARAGQARCLLLTSAEDHPAFPQASGLRALGIPEEETTIWWGMVAPRGVPADRLAALRAAFREAGASERFRQLLESQGVTARWQEGEEMGRAMRLEYEELGRVAQSIGLQRPAR
ncbi:MAG TPA: tripartite tricarboxylate transporter substrate binding protein [Acetobacteraceae bacterium]|nr:tripartite tricarboxylate transporter substrate binding protein [Acetobacteraceae bacterium]